jgi:hypothetical protein
MKQIALRWILLCTAAFFLGINVGHSSGFGEKQPLIVEFLKGCEANVLFEQWRSDGTLPVGFEVVRKVSKRRDAYLLHITENVADLEIFTKKLEASECVKHAYVPHRLEPRNRQPNDPFYGNQWHMDIIKAPEVWDITTGGQTASGHEIVVAVMDYGYQVDHLDLGGNLWVNNGEVPNDGIDNDGNGYVDDYLGLNVLTGDDKHTSHSHGTSVAGLIGAKGDNALGVTGVNWDVKLMLFSPMDWVHQLIEALEYCIEMRKRFNETNGEEGALIVATNLSLGVSDVFPDSSSELQDWCDRYEEAGNLGILNVVAAPNSHINIGIKGDMPSLCPSPFIISVTNTDQSDRKVFDAGFSREHVDIGAPGDESFSTHLNNEYREFGGCSASAPHVAGAIGLLYSLPFDNLNTMIFTDPARAARCVQKAILNGSDKLPSLGGVTTSGGRLNLQGAMEELRTCVLLDSIGENNLKIVNIYPNPADDYLNVEFESNRIEPVHIQFFNVLGQEIYKLLRYPDFEIITNVPVNVINWTPGMYHIRLSNSRGSTHSSFIVH